jgi:hypothetical protein
MPIVPAPEYTAIETVNIRANADPDSKKVGTVSKGEVVGSPDDHCETSDKEYYTACGHRSNEWRAIAYRDGGNRVGYVANACLKK